MENKIKYYENNNNVILENPDSFNIKEILECGQCFRFFEISNMEYLVIAFEKELHIKQEIINSLNTVTFYNTSINDFENIWINYFDLNRNYNSIKEILKSKDNILKDAIDYAEGIRIINQDKWECLISFIISQNNRIPMIKKVIDNISVKYGNKINEYYSFPSFETLKNATVDDLATCKTGFRAKYILDATNKANEGQLNFWEFEKMDIKTLREKLITINGVGPKVADCVMLFSCKKQNAFPTDVWVKRVMQHFYFNDEETNINIINQFAQDRFGDYAGFAQQYLFYYARQFKIGAK